jgi:hypothetical protein
VLEEQLRDAGRELRAVASSAATARSIGDRIDDVQRRRAARRRRRQAVLGVASVVVLLGATFAVLQTRHSDVHHVVADQRAGEGDTAAADREIATTIKTVFERGHALADRLALIDDSTGLAGVIEQAQADPRTPSLTIVVDWVAHIQDTATAHVTYYLSGAEAATGDVILVPRKGRWVVTRASYCQVVSAAVQCPASGEDFVAPPSSIASASGGPADAAIADVMRRTVPDDAPSQHFEPSERLTIPDGDGGTITAIVGIPVPTADAGGQVTFFWHNDQFLGWNANHETYKMSVSAAGPGAFALVYVYFDDTPEIGPSTESVVYRWSGRTILPVTEPAARLFGPRIHLVPAPVGNL